LHPRFSCCAIVLGGDRAQPITGYYSPDENSGKIYPCQDPVGERCVGIGDANGPFISSGCNIGYRGILCNECENGFFAESNVCISCSKENTASPTIISVLTFLFFFGLALCVLQLPDKTLDHIAVTVGSCQRVLAAGSSIYVYFTPEARIAFDYFRVIRLDFSYLRGQCSGTEYTLIVQFFISLGVLMLIYILFILAALFYQYRHRNHRNISHPVGSPFHPPPRPSEVQIDQSTNQSSGDQPQSPKRNGSANENSPMVVAPSSSWKSFFSAKSNSISTPHPSRASESQSATIAASTPTLISNNWLTNPSHPRVMRAMIFLFYLTYVQLSILSLSLFNCLDYPIYADLIPATPTLRLSTDQTVICYQGQHLAAVFFALLALLIGCVIPPIWFVYQLRDGYRRSLLSSHRFHSNWSFLYRGMKPNYYWYRSLAFVIHFSFAIQAALIKPDLATQLYASLSIYFAQILFMWMLIPYQYLSNQYRSCSIIFFQCAGCSGLLFLARKSSSSTSSILLVAEIGFALSSFFAMATLFACVFYLGKERKPHSESAFLFASVSASRHLTMDSNHSSINLKSKSRSSEVNISALGAMGTNVHSSGKLDLQQSAGDRTGRLDNTSTSNGVGIDNVRAASAGPENKKQRDEDNGSTTSRNEAEPNWILNKYARSASRLSTVDSS